MDQLSDKKTKVLLLVSHPDDEIIFCGGTMLAHPHCQWMIVSMTDDGRQSAFNNSIEELKRNGVNIIFHKTLGQKNVPIHSRLTDLAAEKEAWKKALEDEKISPDIVITHNRHGEYGHAAHKLLSDIADGLYRNVWKFVYPIEKTANFLKAFKITLSADILQKKKELFIQAYPSEQYIWKALRPVMDFYFIDGVESFGLEKSKGDEDKKKILVVLPDRFVKSTGGIGANSGPVFEILSKEYDFYVVGHPLMGTLVPSYIKEYAEVINPFTEVRSPVIGIATSQLGYFSKAIHFPKPDIVLAFDWSIYLAATEIAHYFNVPLIARMSMSPILLSAQGYTFGLDLKKQTEKAVHNLFCEMEIRGLKSADRIIQVSKSYEKKYEKIAPTYTDKTRVVIDGIDVDAWKNTDPLDYQLPGKNTIKIVFLGRLSEVKGIIPLCKAKVPDGIDLVFIGPRRTADTVCIQAIDEKVARENNVFYIDALYGKDKMKALKTAHALIVPSYHESFGGVALEGLASGSVVLSSRAYGLSDFLNDHNSIFCGTTPKEIEAAYGKFLGQSEIERAAMINAGFETCQTLTLESTANQLKKVFEELLD